MEGFKLTRSAIAFATNPSLASADSRCVTSRLKKKPELVRYYLQLTFDYRAFMLTFEDVTTRGNYYPDKSMATAAVSQPLLSGELADGTTESSALSPCYEHV